MATDVQIQYRRRTAAQLATFTPALAEIIVDTTNNRLIVGDGSTVGGIPLAKLSEAGGSSPTFTAAGIGTAADSGNPLSVLANTALFNAKGTGTGTGGTGDMRVKLNKAAAANTASLLFQDAFSGRAEVGLTADDNLHFKVSADGSTFRDALVLNASTGDAQVLSLNGGPLAGLRSRIINGNFSINQRAVTGTVTLAAGVYGHDRWKAGASGCTYTFAASGIDTTATISAGTLSQVIEAANMEGSIYTLSWSGSTQARVYQGSPTGSYAASPIIVTGLSANSNTVIEFNTGTLGKVQFEPGVIATPFERRPAGLELMLCQRYFEKATTRQSPQERPERMEFWLFTRMDFRAPAIRQVST